MYKLHVHFLPLPSSYYHLEMQNSHNNNTESYPAHSESTHKVGVADRVRGAINVVHGLGENIRGTALGAADTILKSSDGKNDAIAENGRREMQQGLAALKGQSRVDPSHTTTTAAPLHDREPIREGFPRSQHTPSALGPDPDAVPGPHHATNGNFADNEGRALHEESYTNTHSTVLPRHENAADIHTSAPPLPPRSGHVPEGAHTGAGFAAEASTHTRPDAPYRPESTHARDKEEIQREPAIETGTGIIGPTGPTADHGANMRMM